MSDFSFEKQAIREAVEAGCTGVRVVPGHMALPLELKNIALQLRDDLEAARIARDAWERKYYERHDDAKRLRKALERIAHGRYPRYREIAREALGEDS